MSLQTKFVFISNTAIKLVFIIMKNLFIWSKNRYWCFTVDMGRLSPMLRLSGFVSRLATTKAEGGGGRYYESYLLDCLA